MKYGLFGAEFSPDFRRAGSEVVLGSFVAAQSWLEAGEETEIESQLVPPDKFVRWSGRRRISERRRAPALGCRAAKGNSVSSKTTSREM